MVGVSHSRCVLVYGVCVCIIHSSMSVVFMILRVSFNMSVLLCVVSCVGGESFIVWVCVYCDLECVL